MAGRSRSTFGKRQKETKRLEKRQDKAARKEQRKQEKQTGTGSDSGESTSPHDRFADFGDINDDGTDSEP